MMSICPLTTTFSDCEIILKLEIQPKFMRSVIANNVNIYLDT